MKLLSFISAFIFYGLFSALTLFAFTSEFFPKLLVIKNGAVFNLAIVTDFSIPRALRTKGQEEKSFGGQ